MKPPATPSLRLLIAEDDLLIRKTIVAAARHGGFTVAGEAETGQEAITQAFALKPDAVLMDIRMPGLDGLEATRQIQASQPTPTVIITAHHSPELLRDVAASGAGAYLLKPPDPADLARGIAIARARHSDIMNMKALVQQKDLLVREVYHRVANQLNITSSLLNLQSLRVGHAAARSALLEAEHRILAMARIHTALQHTGSQADIPLSAYLSSLAGELITGLRPDLKYREIITGPAPAPSAATTITCGLIVHELVMNCIRHAFNRRAAGTIELSLHTRINGAVRLAIRDNGAGFPEGFRMEQSESLGLLIVSTLTADLGGHFSMAHHPPGTECVVEFTPPLKEPP